MTLLAMPRRLILFMLLIRHDTRVCRYNIFSSRYADTLFCFEDICHDTLYADDDMPLLPCRRPPVRFV